MMTHSYKLDIQQEIDNSRFSFFHWKIIVLGFFILAIDGYDTAAMGYIAPALSDDWGIPKQSLGLVLSAALLGLSLGALVAGPISDRIGRKKVLIYSCLFFGLSSLASAYASSLNLLTFWRFMTGLGLGAAMPNAITLISEYAPARCRALAINTMYCGFPLGAAAGGFISSWLVPLYGWQSVLLLGAIMPLALTLLLVFLLPESVKYLVSKQRYPEKVRQILILLMQRDIKPTTQFYLYQDPLTQTKSSLGLLFSSRYLIGTLMLWLTYFMGLIIYYVLLSWMPILMNGLGYQLQQSAILTSLFTLGGTLGIIIAGWLMDRWNAYKVVSCGFMVTALLIVLMSTQNSQILLLGGLIFLMGVTMNGAQSGLQSLAVNFYPTHSRATGISWMQGIGRFGGVAGTLLAAQLLNMHWQVDNILLFMCIPALVATIATLINMHHRFKNGG
ncbi:putative transporter protein [Yersinia aldovae]|nr:putative transporter protein [Yersinia aldovae]